jgi:hypothetical protein
MMTGYSSLRIASFAYRIDKPGEAANVDRLDRAVVWHCRDITLPGIGHLPVRPAAARRRAPNSIFAAQRDNVLDGPIAGRSARIRSTREVVIKAGLCRGFCTSPSGGRLACRRWRTQRRRLRERGELPRPFGV